MLGNYDKIETLFDRDKETFNVIEGQIRLPEFRMIDSWFVTEKIHGMNIHICYQKTKDEYESIFYYGRTLKSELPVSLKNFLSQVFNIDTFRVVFPDLKIEECEGIDMGEIHIYGEGYGSGIQNGGNYREDVSFRLFDVQVNGLWLEPENIKDIANKFGIETVPFLGYMSIDEIVNFVKSEPHSVISSYEGGNPNYFMEGIVARTKPLLLRRNGERLMFKLKRSDFHGGKKR